MLKDRIFKTSTPILTPVTLNDGVTVYVRSLSGAELGRVHHLTETLRKAGKDPTEVNVLAVIWAVCDEDGKPVFDAQDSEAVSALPWQTFQQLVQAILKASGLASDSLDEAKND